MQNVFDEARERGIRADEALQHYLTLLKNVSGADASLVRLYDVKDAGLATLAPTIATLMACIDALSSRVALLEQDVT